MDPWEIMDDWCKEQSDTLAEQGSEMFAQGVDLDDREFRRLFGQSQAFGRMRSFIHSARLTKGTGNV